MARIWVATDDLSGGTLPAVCAVSGRPTDHLARRRFGQPPAWLPDAALALPFVPLLLRGGVEGMVPLREVTERRIARLERVRDIAIGFAVALLLVWLYFDIASVLVLFVLALAIGGVWTWFARQTALLGKVDDTGDWVELLGVHPRFVTETEPRYIDQEA